MFISVRHLQGEHRSDAGDRISFARLAPPTAPPAVEETYFEEDDETDGDVLCGVELCVVRCHGLMLWMEAIVRSVITSGGYGITLVPRNVVAPLQQVLQVSIASRISIFYDSRAHSMT